MDLDKPAQMQSVISVTGGCQVKFSWDTPFDGKSPIIKYNIQVESGSGIFKSLDKCGDDPSTKTCSVSFQTLAAEPFLIRNNQIIKVRA
jgi:hypothetical protein